MILRLTLFAFAFLLLQSAKAQSCPDSCSFFIPRTITPDCGNIDCSLLKVEASCSFSKFEFSLFNRWGELIFESTNPNMVWDSGERRTTETLIWKLKATWCNGTKIDSRGEVTLVM